MELKVGMMGDTHGGDPAARLEVEPMQGEEHRKQRKRKTGAVVEYLLLERVRRGT